MPGPQTVATWRLNIPTHDVEPGTFCLLDVDNPDMWMACEHPVSIRNFCGLAAGVGI